MVITTRQRRAPYVQGTLASAMNLRSFDALQEAGRLAQEWLYLEGLKVDIHDKLSRELHDDLIRQAQKVYNASIVGDNMGYRQLETYSQGGTVYFVEAKRDDRGTLLRTRHLDKNGKLVKDSTKRMNPNPVHLDQRYVFDPSD